MARNILGKARVLVVHGLATAAVVTAFALSSVGAQVAATLGVSSLALATTTTPAQAQWGWREGWRHSWRRGEGWRRGWRRRGWDDGY